MKEKKRKLEERERKPRERVIREEGTKRQRKTKQTMEEYSRMWVKRGMNGKE